MSRSQGGQVQGRVHREQGRSAQGHEPVRGPLTQVGQALDGVRPRADPVQHDPTHPGQGQALHDDPDRHRHHDRQHDPAEPTGEVGQPEDAQEDQARDGQEQAGQLGSHEVRDAEPEAAHRRASRGGGRHVDLRRQGRRPAAPLTSRDDLSVGQQGLVVESGTVVHPHVQAQRAVDADEAPVADLDRAEPEHAVLDPVPEQLGVGPDARVVPDGDEVPGGALSGVEGAPGTDLGTHEAEHERLERRPVQAREAAECLDPVAEPPAPVVQTPQGVLPRPVPADDDPLGDDGEGQEDRPRGEEHDQPQGDRPAGRHGADVPGSGEQDEQSERDRPHGSQHVDREELQGEGREAFAPWGGVEHGPTARRATRGRRSGSAGLLRRYLLEPFRQAAHRRELVGVADGDGARDPLPQSRRHPSRHEGVPAEVDEEVVGHRDRLHPEDLLPDADDLAFEVGPRRDVLPRRTHQRILGRGQLVAVDLPGRRAGQLLDDVEEPGNHVRRQPALEQ